MLERAAHPILDEKEPPTNALTRTNSGPTNVRASRRRRLAKPTEEANAMETTEALNSPPPLSVAGMPSKTRRPRHGPQCRRRSHPPLKPLITEQQVMFGTAAAAGSRRENRLMAALRRVFATSTTETRAWRQHSVQRRMYYIESAAWHARWIGCNAVKAAPFGHDG